MVVVAAGCASTDIATPSRTIPQGTAAPGTTAPQVCTPETPVVPAAGKPTVTVPATKPTSLQSTDITVGTGPEAKTGDTVKMQYVGVSAASGKEFDSSWSRNADPFSFTIGGGQVIKGWDQGVPGMKVGGRRELVIPPDLGYGASPPGTDIAANDTLIFVVDLVQVCSSSTTAGSTPATVAPASIPAEATTAPVAK
jgi:hypothetical protein